VSPSPGHRRLATIGIKRHKPWRQRCFSIIINNRKYNGVYASSDNNSMYRRAAAQRLAAGNPNYRTTRVREDAWKETGASVSTETDPVKQQQIYSRSMTYRSILDHPLQPPADVYHSKRCTAWRHHACRRLSVHRCAVGFRCAIIAAATRTQAATLRTSTHLR